MADLDDFFAKKDKRNKGKGKKYTSTIKSLEPPPPAPEQERKEIKIDISTAPTQDDEWKEEKVPTHDLEGLKVQALVSDELKHRASTAHEDEPERDDSGDEEEDDGSKTQAAASPWQSVTQQAVESQQQQQQQQQAPDKLSSMVVGGTYVPPSLRRSQPTAKSRLPPDLSSTTAFPTLLATSQTQPKESKSKDTGDFQEVVRSSSKSRGAEQPYRPPGLQLANKYGTLRND